MFFWSVIKSLPSHWILVIMRFNREKCSLNRKMPDCHDGLEAETQKDGRYVWVKEW